MKAAPLLLGAGFALWLLDFWAWALNENDVLWAQALGTMLIYAAVAVTGHTKEVRYREVALMHIGSGAWMFGVLAAAFVGTTTSNGADFLVIATLGEIAFFIGVCAFGLYQRRSMTWILLWLFTVIGAIAWMISQGLFGYNIATESPVALVGIMTLYSIVVLAAFHGDISFLQRKQNKTQNTPA